uniref:Lig_chan-Glu_bd domain-containing protein n=1 Tax=Mesocestoides corti TaxID=53468 RepID=A0A5K3FIN3_MESCO
MQMALMGMLLLATICSISAESIQLNVGIILEGTHAGQETALRKGVQRANQNLAELRLHAPLKITLHPILKRIEEGSAFAASEAACELVAENVVAIFGPDSKAASGPAQWISQQYSIPYFLAQGDLDTDETLFNFTVNLHPHFEDVGEALVDFIQGTQGWEELGLIYAHDDNLIKYKSLFSKFSRKLTVRKWDGADQRHKYIIKYFRRTRSQNKFVVDIPRTETEGFLRLIAEYNMTDQYYSYVFTDWDTQFLDPKAFVVDKGANFSALSLLPLMGFNYQMTEDTHRPFSQSPAFLPSRGASSSTARSSLTYYFLISDTLNLLSIGISRLAESRTIEPPSGLSCKAAGNWSLGPHLLSAIKSVKGNDAEGSTGLVEFGSEGRRKNVNITILEMGKDGFLEYGYWNRKDKLVVTKDFSKTKSEIQKELKGQTLRVATIEEIPFMMYKGPSGHVKSSDPKDWHGFCIDLLNECASALEFNYTVHPVADGNYGTATKVNGEVVWDGIIGQLQFRKADLAVAMLTINLERERVIDFTTPFMNLGVSIIFKKPEQNEPDLFSFLRPLSPAAPTSSQKPRRPG